MSFLIPVVVLVGAIGYWASRRSTSGIIGDPRVEANALGSLLFGVALVVAMLPFSSPFTLLPDVG